MNCVKCGSKTTVIDTRNQEWRRRECKSAKCGHRFYTQEVVVDGFVARGKKREATAATPEAIAKRQERERLDEEKRQRAAERQVKQRTVPMAEWQNQAQNLEKLMQAAQQVAKGISEAAGRAAVDTALHPAFVRRMPPGTAVRLGK